METINLLDFLNKVNELDTLDYSTCGPELVNFLDLIIEDHQFTQKVDLGVIYLKSKVLNHYTIVDGLNRILSLSLLLHAVCECYKKTSSQNEKAINIIRKKYLLDGDKTKLRLPNSEQIIYEKIIFGERLSGKEKNTSIFKLLHNFWSQIKLEELKAAQIFDMLKKVYVVKIDVENASVRDLYYTLNKNNNGLNQFLLIKDYLRDLGIESEWDKLNRILTRKQDINLFFKDFFVTKFKFKTFEPTRLYEIFVNYFETMLQYMSEDMIISKMIKSAVLYNNILNLNMQTDALKSAMVKIKMHDGEDTYAYILNVYEDYVDNNLSEATFLEILSTIDEYLRNRRKTPNNVAFNELINYLNAFITCK